MTLLLCKEQRKMGYFSLMVEFKERFLLRKSFFAIDEDSFVEMIYVVKEKETNHATPFIRNKVEGEILLTESREWAYKDFPNHLLAQRIKQDSEIEYEYLINDKQFQELKNVSDGNLLDINLCKVLKLNN
ncbi:hypothetical protein [Bacillus swezeyi]|uniref:Uncharacterized protein n=1 Tax=Bacillus swezeyi TaxID=1925020 RepID=A0A5M8RGF2_9BACI|nr:hypothetical protein [Bacillus swezeyi]KAA6446921.1 hypothetical protein DX927_22990 [Bacillus swezeyi]KAA6471489.1 hypothetical protein DX928_23230 [Bacillus swezeyi]